MKLFAMCAYCTSTSSRSLTTHWSPNLYVGFGPVLQPHAPNVLGTAAWRDVVSIGLRSSAPRALRIFLAKLLKSVSLLPLNSWTSAFRFVVCSSVWSVFRQALTSSIDAASATEVTRYAWHCGVGW